MNKLIINKFMLARPRLDLTCKCQCRIIVSVQTSLSQFFHYVRSRLSVVVALLSSCRIWNRRVLHACVYTPCMHIRCVDTRKVWLCPSLHDYNLYGGNADRSASPPLSLETVYRADKQNTPVIAGRNKEMSITGRHGKLIFNNQPCFRVRRNSGSLANGKANRYTTFANVADYFKTVA